MVLRRYVCILSQNYIILLQMEKAGNLTQGEKGVECKRRNVTLTISIKSGDVVTVYEQTIKIINRPQYHCDIFCLTKTMAEVIRGELWLQVGVLGALIVFSLSTLITLAHMCTTVKREKKLV